MMVQFCVVKMTVLVWEAYYCLEALDVGKYGFIPLKNTTEGRYKGGKNDESPWKIHYMIDIKEEQWKPTLIKESAMNN